MRSSDARGRLWRSPRSSLAPAAAQAQYVAPPPDSGSAYIFDGTRDGLGRIVRQVGLRRRHRRAVPAGVRGGAGPGDARHGRARPSWALRRSAPTGTRSSRSVTRSSGIQYTVQNTPASTRNGGVMVRTPEVRYTGTNTAAVLAQKPTGYNYDLCPGALLICGATTPADLDELRVGGSAARSRRRRTPRTRRTCTPAPTARRSGADEPHQPGRERPSDAPTATPTTIST